MRSSNAVCDSTQIACLKAARDLAVLFSRGEDAVSEELVDRVAEYSTPDPTDP